MPVPILVLEICILFVDHYDLADSLGVSVDYLLYPEQPDARIRNIEALLRDKPESFIIAVERLVRLCIEEFSGLE